MIASGSHKGPDVRPTRHADHPPITISVRLHTAMPLLVLVALLDMLYAAVLDSRPRPAFRPRNISICYARRGGLA